MFLPIIADVHGKWKTMFVPIMEMSFKWETEFVSTIAVPINTIDCICSAYKLSAGRCSSAELLVFQGLWEEKENLSKDDWSN